MLSNILLIGKNEPLIDLFFEEGWMDFNLMTSSVRKEDLNRHIQLFQPRMVIYCLNGGDLEEIFSMGEILMDLHEQKILFAICGAKNGDDANSVVFSKAAFVSSDTTSFVIIKSQINSFLVASAENSSAFSSSQVASKTSKKHILAIDDDPLVLKLMLEYLRDDYEVAIAKSGEMAYKFWLFSKKCG